ncbi:MAG: EFR1 family ferrodoxin [Methanoregula sp.]|uniref:EFR1 family ferrodoxin n=1 Tax=Methanoregula sp. TaxID=2052170 RepID=UPI003BB106AC
MKMPGNSPPVSRPPAGEARDRILAAAGARLAEIAGITGKGADVPPWPVPVSTLIRRVFSGPFSRSVHEIDRTFSVSGACISCGTCAEVCPVKNKVIEQGRPLWQHRCKPCCACLTLRMAGTIQPAVMRGTKERGRKPHHGLEVDDLKALAGK